MATRKDVAVSFLRQAASGRVREAYDKHVSKGLPAESLNANGMF